MTEKKDIPIIPTLVRVVIVLTAVLFLTKPIFVDWTTEPTTTSDLIGQAVIDNRILNDECDTESIINDIVTNPQPLNISKDIRC